MGLNGAHHCFLIGQLAIERSLSGRCPASHLHRLSQIKVEPQRLRQQTVQRGHSLTQVQKLGQGMGCLRCVSACWRAESRILA